LDLHASQQDGSRRERLLDHDLGARTFTSEVRRRWWFALERTINSEPEYSMASQDSNESEGGKAFSNDDPLSETKRGPSVEKPELENPFGLRNMPKLRLLATIVKQIPLG
jgi:hypothetical protein